MSFFARGVLCAALLFASAVLEAACVSSVARIETVLNDPDEREAFRRANGIDFGRNLARIRVLTYDHSSPDRSFTMYRVRRDPGQETAAEQGRFFLSDAIAVPRDRDGHALVPAGRGGQVLLFVTETNPLLYRLDAEAPRYEPAANFENLKQILSSLGNLAQAAVRRAGEVRSAFVIERPGIAAAIQCEGLESPLFDTTEINALKAAAVNAAETLAALARDADRVIAIVRRAEQGFEPSTDALPQAAAILERFDAARAKVESARRAYETSDASVHYKCTGLASLARTALTEILAEETPADALEKLRDETLLSTCSAPARESFESLIAVLEDAPACARRYLRDYLDVAAQVAALETRLGEFDPALVESEASAEALAAFLRRYHQVVETAPLCDLQHGILFDRLAVRTDFDESVSRKFKLMPVSPLGRTFVHTRITEIEETYGLKALIDSKLGYGIALTYTPLVQPKWEPVPNPMNAEENVVGRVGEETRAGDLALFASYRLFDWNAIRPALELGVGVGESLQAFGGIAFELGPYIRLGYGRTFQQVDRLPRGVPELSKLPDGTVDPGSLHPVEGDTVPTRSGIDDDYYLSLTVAVESIPLFSRKKEPE